LCRFISNQFEYSLKFEFHSNLGATVHISRQTLLRAVPIPSPRGTTHARGLEPIPERSSAIRNRPPLLLYFFPIVRSSQRRPCFPEQGDAGEPRLPLLFSPLDFIYTKLDLTPCLSSQEAAVLLIGKLLRHRSHRRHCSS
jgi:hypothetical protein